MSEPGHLHWWHQQLHLPLQSAIHRLVSANEHIYLFILFCLFLFTGGRGFAIAAPIATFLNYYFQSMSSITGQHCEEEQVPCASHPCERGGVCRPSADYTSYTCRCPAGWQGTSVFNFVIETNLLAQFVKCSLISVLIHVFCIAFCWWFL